MDRNKIIVPSGQNFSFKECLWYLDRNLDECLHIINGSELQKAIVINDQPVLLNICSSDHSIIAEILNGDFSDETKSAISDYIIDWFDLDRNLEPFYKLLAKNKQVSYMASEFKGLKLVGIPDLFEALCWCIIGQQINLSFAHKVKRRLVEKYGTFIEHAGKRHYIFPHFEVIKNLTMEDLRDMQFSRQKAEYITVIAKAFSNKIISKEALTRIKGFKDRQETLISIKGIGTWTANYVLMKTFKEPSAVPYGDAGILNALMRHSIIKDKKDLSSINNFFHQFPGWESYMVFYLWRSLAVQAE
jgi:DNA-3-methyladenine glycosylase II